MNILIPDSWLREHLETAATPEEIQRSVSLCGPSVERIHELEGEPVYDVEITTNRVDSYSVRGFAREAAVILTQFGMPSQLKLVSNYAIPQPNATSLELPKIIDPTGLCNRTLCVVLDQVRHTETPTWMARRLKQIEQTVHDSVVDITNYITHELGHPCHAFDYDKIMQLGGEIHVTTAKAGTAFTTLDGKDYQTVGGEVVFTNHEGKIIDLPAIKGTANTAVDDDTKRVLLWIESIDAQRIRRASMAHAIRTVAAQLNEKHVDPELALPVLTEGVRLYQELCDAVVASPVLDTYTKRQQPQVVTITHTELLRYLGISVTAEQVTEIMETLGCQVSPAHKPDTATNDFVLEITPPSFRPDIAIPADVVEEVARIIGYHNLPSVIMDTPIPTNRPENTNFALEIRMKRFLAATGWQEAYTYSMVSETLATASGYTLNEHAALANPLTDDRIYLRRSLLPSLAEFVQSQASAESCSVFEFANRYDLETGDRNPQAFTLSLVSTKPYRVVRGQVEAMLAHCFSPSLEILPDATPQPGFKQSGTVMAEGRKLGSAGVTNSGLVGFELIWQELLKICKTHPRYTPIPTTAAIREDLTFSLESDTLVGPVLSTIKEQSSLIEHVRVKDIFATDTARRVTFAITYRDTTENISNQMVEPIRKQIVTAIQQKHTASLVGEV